MLCRDAAPSVSWIASDAALADAARDWSDVIGIDTEFQRTNTFYPMPGLYQIASAGRIYLLDPLAIGDFEPLARHLRDPAVRLVMHACGEDLELMNSHLDVSPSGIFDTQLANAFLSPDYALSYTNLVERHLGITLGKPETRSNWRMRPLTDAQLRYACEDVVHLPELYDRLRERLERLGRLDWFEDAMRGQGSYQGGRPDEYYRNLKNAWRLSGQELAVLRALVGWRERKAMSEDVPRNRVVWDEHLLELARRPSLEEADVWSLLPKPIARRYAAEILAAHRQGSGNAPLPRLEAPLSRAESEASRRLREVAREAAERHGFAQELLARKRDVESCLRHFLAEGELSPFYRGWREALVGDAFRDVLGSLA